jgi:hypothetical protein
MDHREGAPPDLPAAAPEADREAVPADAQAAAPEVALCLDAGCVPSVSSTSR